MTKSLNKEKDNLKQYVLLKQVSSIGRYITTRTCLFKKLLFTMENATAADSSQSNISRVYILKRR